MRGQVQTGQSIALLSQACATDVARHVAQVGQIGAGVDQLAQIICQSHSLKNTDATFESIV